MSSQLLANLTKIGSEIIDRLFSPLTRKRQQAETLAVRVEAMIRQLSSLPPDESTSKELVVLLNTSCLLLERFLENPELLSKYRSSGLSQSNNSIHIEATQEKSIEPNLIPKIEQETKISITAQELIKLRDWVLLAKTSKDSLNPQILEVIDRKIGEILTKEGVISLEETGLFNYERQQIISTQLTNEPDKNNWISNTVRPGYLFCEKLLRPQEVIVYTFERSLVNTE